MHTNTKKIEPYRYHPLTTFLLTQPVRSRQLVCHPECSVAFQAAMPPLSWGHSSHFLAPREPVSGRLAGHSWPAFVKHFPLTNLFSIDRRSRVGHFWPLCRLSPQPPPIYFPRPSTGFRLAADVLLEGSPLL